VGARASETTQTGRWKKLRTERRPSVRTISSVAQEFIVAVSRVKSRSSTHGHADIMLKLPDRPSGERPSLNPRE